MNKKPSASLRWGGWTDEAIVRDSQVIVRQYAGWTAATKSGRIEHGALSDLLRDRDRTTWPSP